MSPSASITAQASAMRTAAHTMGGAFHRAALRLCAAFDRGRWAVTTESAVAPLAARCPACDRRMRVAVDRLDGRLRRHRGPDGAPCRCRALVRDAVAVEALALTELASAYRMRAATRRALLTNPLRKPQPGDLRRVLRWEDRAAVAEHAAMRLRAWAGGAR